jgi:hypothetical protein
MPRYFFHIRDGSDIADLEGTELPDLSSARVAAVELAGSMLREHAEKFWNGEDWRVEVADKSGLILFSLHFSAVEAPAIGRPAL